MVTESTVFGPWGPGCCLHQNRRCMGCGAIPLCPWTELERATYSNLRTNNGFTLNCPVLCIFGWWMDGNAYLRHSSANRVHASCNLVEYTQCRHNRYKVTIAMLMYIIDNIAQAFWSLKFFHSSLYQLEIADGKRCPADAMDVQLR